jgi:hypothetical protein
MHRVGLELMGATAWFERRGLRYDLLDRMARWGADADLVLLAFGMGRAEVRLVVEGRASAVHGFGRRLRTWLSRRAAKDGQDLVVVLRRPERLALTEAVVWAHRLPIEDGASGPLASPWTSHRDLLRFRRAPFYDAGVLRRRVDGRLVHRDCGGRRLPRGWPPKGQAPELDLLLRMAAAVSGRLPGDRRSFRLFAHLGRSAGRGTSELARALDLTPRRVRQLLAEDEPLLNVARRCLGDPRLCQVP